MKIATLTLFAFLLLFINGFSQQWMQTASNPDGAGVTDMLVTDLGTLIVTTASWNTSPGFRGGIRRSTNDGQSWTNPTDGFNGRTLHKGENGTLFASYWPLPPGEEGLYRSTNEGVSWNLIQTVPSGDNIFSITSKDNNNTIFIGTRNGVKRSTTGGAPFQYINNGIPANSWVRDLEIDTSNGIVLAATTNGFFTTTNNGDSWQMATGITTGDTIVKIGLIYSSGVTLDGESNNKSLLGTSNGNVYVAVDNSFYLGITFLALFKNTETSSYYSQALQSFNQKTTGTALFPKTGTINQNGGFKKSDDGQNFKTENEGLPLDTKPSALTGYSSPISKGSKLTFLLGSFEFNSKGAKVFKRDYIVGMQQISSEVPESFSLKQNYPNPFNPSTRINFNVGKKELVTLEIFNSLGVQVAELVKDELQPGEYSYEFSSKGLPSGVYFYKLQSNEFTETRRMILVK